MLSVEGVHHGYDAVRQPAGALSSYHSPAGNYWCHPLLVAGQVGMP
ncbi:hypothetical protein B0I31_102346 [Saccharothrix carnea]|uniref:Uncharacterized protein n=1 Tax=Saccharothrix carnea TaxID=1280637 RepID=A0A2P8IFX0_SACCR|nr:hypothetical protein B0I31_102346 [Saccharothrix carnea]